MRRRDFLTSAPVITAMVPGRASTKTNVVMIMTDDHGAWSLGCYGNSEGYTPNLDGLAKDGARFTRAYAAAAVCSPSRMTYLTGKIPSRHGVQDYIRDERSGPKARQFLKEHTTYSEILEGHSYTLGYFGKWHMGDAATPQKGFTHWHTTAGGSYRATRFYRGGDVDEVEQYPTDWITDRAIEFIEARRGQPFFAQVSYNAPHTPYDFQPEKYRRPYRDSAFPAFPRDEPHVNQIEVYRKYLGNRESRWSYMALVRGVDQNVGLLLRKLDELGLRQNTLVIFCADQGFNCGHHGVWGKGNGTLPFNMYEQTIQIPLLFRQPGTIAAGTVVESMVSTLDFFPTLLDYLGLPAYRAPDLHGRSFAGFLKGDAPPQWQNKIHAEYAYVRMIRNEQFKYIQKADGHGDEMYDLEMDASESRNVARDPTYAVERGRLKDELSTWFAVQGAPPIEEWRKTVRNALDPRHYDF